MTENNNHDGHRDRVREKIKIGGLDTFHDHEVLEYILFSLIPRKDVNDLAHDLINKFNGFAGVLDASYDELRQVKNMTDNAAIYLTTLPEIFTRYQTSKDEEKPILSSKIEIMDYARRRIGNSPTEVLLLICMDVKKQVLRCTPFSSDSRSMVSITTKEVVSEAIKCGAYYVATAHNHPSGDSSPSIPDINFAKELKFALEIMDIKYVDNVIIARNGNTSFAAVASNPQNGSVKNSVFKPSFTPSDFAPFDKLDDLDD